MLTFNGVDFDDIGLSAPFKVVAIEGRDLIGIENQTQVIPGRMGSLQLETRITDRIITITFVLDSGHIEVARNDIDIINKTLNTGNIEVPFMFSDDLFGYTGKLDGDASGWSVSPAGRITGQIKLKCSDPRKKLANEIDISLYRAGVGDDTNVVVNDVLGTTDTEPIFEIEAVQDIVHFEILHNDEYMQVGQPQQEDIAPVDHYEPVVIDDLENFDNWSTVPGGTALRSGLVGGTMGLFNGSNGTPIAFTPEDYGTNPNGYVGPAKRLVLPEALQDFKIEFDLTSLNLDGGMGKIFLELLDEDDNNFGFLAMSDVWNDANKNQAQVIIGLEPTIQPLINTTGVNFDTVYNNFHGILTLERNGDTFTAYSAQVDDATGLNFGRFIPRDPFTDSNGQFQNKLAQVIIHIVKYKNFRVFRQFARGMRIYKVNNPSINQVPVIAHAGDLITFDHVEKSLLLNGDSALKSQKDIFADYFNLQPGINTLTINPPDVANVNIRWRPARL